MFEKEINDFMSEIQKIQALAILDEDKKRQKSAACLYEKLSLLEENQRLNFFNSLITHLDKAAFSYLSIYELLFLMYVFPTSERYDFINRLEQLSEAYFFIHHSFMPYFLEGLPQEHWKNFLQNHPLHFSEGDIVKYFEFFLFNSQQISIIRDNAKSVLRIQNAYLPLITTNLDEFSVWKDTLIEFNQFFKNHQQFIDCLKSLNDKIGIYFPSNSVNNEIFPAERIYNYSYPSAQAFNLTIRKSYDGLINDWLLQKERLNGLNLPPQHKEDKGQVYLCGVIPPDLMQQLVQLQPRTLFTEIVANREILLHGHLMHRLQWRAIQDAVEKKYIILPENKNISDLYDALMKIQCDQKTMWDTLIDRVSCFNLNDLQNPERLQSYLLTSPEVKQELPHLNWYLENSFFKKIQRLFVSSDASPSENQANDYIQLMESSVNKVFFKIVDNTPEAVISFEKSINTAITANSNRQVSSLLHDKKENIGIFFKKPFSSRTQRHQSFQENSVNKESAPDFGHTFSS